MNQRRDMRDMHNWIVLNVLVLDRDTRSAYCQIADAFPTSPSEAIHHYFVRLGVSPIRDDLQLAATHAASNLPANPVKSTIQSNTTRRTEVTCPDRGGSAAVSRRRFMRLAYPK